MKRIWWVTATIAVLSLVAGCKNNGNNQNSTDMRVLNAVIDAEPLDVLVDGDVKAAAVALGVTSPYSNFSSGTRDVQVRSSTLGTILSDKSVALGDGVHSTLVVYGKRSSISTLVLTDDNPTAPASGNFDFRVLGLSPDTGPVDVYLTASDVSSVPATIPNVGFGAVTTFSEVTAGSYKIIFTTAGTKDVIFQTTAATTYAAGAVVTVGIFPAFGGKLVNGVVLTSGSSASGTFLANPLGRLKAVNAVPDSTPLNFKADGTTLLSNVPFGGSSSYVTTSSGAHTLQLEASNVPGSTIASLAQTIDSARDYTMVAVNNLSLVQLVTFADDNTVPVTGFAKVRFANTMVGSTVVDALVNFASQASSIPYKGTSSYYQLAPSLTYTFTFATAGGVSVITALTPVEIDAGGIYTVYLMGNAAAPQAKLVRDR
jgi:outer membrane murein-binding lipoprotein Lpp